MDFSGAGFLFIFLPAVVIAYRLLPGPLSRRALLCAAGLVFYAVGSIGGAALLILAAAVNYAAGLLIMGGRRPRLVSALAVILDLGFLAAFKYLDFFLGSFNALSGADAQLVGLAAPAGVSFFIFKCCSYVIDVRRSKEAGARSFLDVLLYISFFPQVMSGPITRFADLAPQLRALRWDGAAAATGLRRLIRGLAKKVLIASSLGSVADAMFALPVSDISLPLAWLGAAAYTLQIYFDFSGYSDMAIGLGETFGIKTPENFDHPYAAASIKDFWRRWHISLSSWFRDYLYIPLGGSRRGKGRECLNKFLVFLLCGLWHGANWTFVLWGVWHGLLSLLEGLRVIDTDKLSRSAVGRVLSRVYTLLAVTLGFVMFRAESVAQGFGVIGRMIAGSSSTPASSLALANIATPMAIATLIIACVLTQPVGARLREIVSKRGGLTEGAAWVGSLVLLALCVAAISAGAFSPFIYFQF